MHPFSSFTPHYAEDVSYSLSALKSVGDEGVNLESLLQARVCTPCISAPPRRPLHPLHPLRPLHPLHPLHPLRPWHLLHPLHP